MDFFLALKEDGCLDRHYYILALFRDMDFYLIAVKWYQNLWITFKACQSKDMCKNI